MFEMTGIWVKAVSKANNILNSKRSLRRGWEIPIFVL
jgi:hypothetical protein